MPRLYNNFIVYKWKQCDYFISIIEVLFDTGHFMYISPCLTFPLLAFSAYSFRVNTFSAFP